MSETCRVIINQVKQKLHLVGYLLIRYFKDARYHEQTKKNVFIVLTYNFSKEHYVLPEDDLRIETCRSLLNILM